MGSAPERCRDSTYVIGIDLGGTHIRAGLVDEGGHILRRAATDTPASEGVEAVLDRIEHLTREVCVDVPLSDVHTIALAVPGPIDITSHTVRFAPNLRGWQDVPVAELLSRRLGRPVLIGNDANLATLGEHRFGAGRGIDHLIYITVSTGIGGGVIIDGRLLLGQHGYASEIGHHTVNPDGPLCKCGKHGCLEALASGTAVAREGRLAVVAGEPTRLKEACGGDIWRIDARMVTEVARQGDEIALDILASAGYYLGVGIANLLHMFNPRRVILGGGLMKAEDLLTDPMWDAIREHAHSIYLEDLGIVEAALGDDTGILGAAALALGVE